MNNEFKSTFVRDNFDYEERCILNDIVIRPDRNLIMRTLQELSENAEGEEDDNEKNLTLELIQKVEKLSDDEVRLMYDELPVEEHTGLSDQMLQARLQKGEE